MSIINEVSHSIRRKSVLIAAAILSLSSCSTDAPSLEKYEPEDGQCLVFIGQDMEAVGGVEGFVGYADTFGAPYGFTTYTAIRPGDVDFGYTYQGIDGLFFESDWGAGVSYADRQLESPVLAGCSVAIGLEWINHEEELASGKYDEMLFRLADWFKSHHDTKFFLRPGYEFDGHDWNHYQPEPYVRAFRRVRDVLDSRGVDNVAYVWQSCGTVYDVDDIMSFYPGDDYVDWFGYSQFRSGRSQIMIDLAREHGKPVFIAEATPMFGTSDGPAEKVDLKDNDDAEKAWDIWFKELFAAIEENPDVVKAVSYINCDWPSQEMWKNPDDIFCMIDSRLQTSPVIAPRWRSKMSDHRYVSMPEQVGK